MQSAGKAAFWDHKDGAAATGGCCTWMPDDSRLHWEQSKDPKEAPLSPTNKTLCICMCAGYSQTNFSTLKGFFSPASKVAMVLGKWAAAEVSFQFRRPTNWRNFCNYVIMKVER